MSYKIKNTVFFKDFLNYLVSRNFFTDNNITFLSVRYLDSEIITADLLKGNKKTKTTFRVDFIFSENSFYYKNFLSLKRKEKIDNILKL